MFKLLFEPKKQYINISAFLAIVILFVYAVINIFIADYLPALLEILWAIGILVAAFLVNYTKKQKTGIQLASLVLYVMALYNFATGGFAGTGLFWVIVIINVLFFINNASHLFWIINIWITSFFISVAYGLGIVALPYTCLEIVMYFISSATIAFFTYLYRIRIQHDMRELQKKNEEIELNAFVFKQKNDELRRSNEELIDITQEMEKANAKMTSQTQLINELEQKLMSE